MAGHSEWRAKIEPLGHGKEGEGEGEGNLLVDGAFRCGKESICGMESFV
jgi:hypothetical protein